MLQTPCEFLSEVPMNTLRTPQLVPVSTTILAEAINLCDWLAVWLTLPDLATLDQVDGQFAKLHTVIEAIPPTVVTRGMMAYFRNRFHSSLALRNAGDFHTAAYQLREMSRKLARL
jgi:hypothetical protein